MDRISRKIEQNDCIYKAYNDVVGIAFCVIRLLYMFTYYFYSIKYMLRKKTNRQAKWLYYCIELTSQIRFNTKSIVLQNIAVKIYYKNKNNTSFLYISLKSRKTYTANFNGSPLMGRVFKIRNVFLHGFVGF